MIVWDAQQNRYVVKQDNQPQQPGTSAVSSTPQAEGKITWDAKQNKYVVGQPQQTDQSKGKSDIGGIIGNFVSNLINSVKGEAGKVGQEAKQNLPGTAFGLVPDFLKGVAKGGVGVLSNVQEMKNRIAGVVPPVLRGANADQELQAGQGVEKFLRGVQDSSQLKAQTTLGKDIISPVAEFVAPSLIAPEAEGAGFLAKLGSFALQTQLIYSPDENTKNELQGRFTDLASSILPFVGFEKIAKPIFGKMLKAVGLQGEKAVADAMKVPSETTDKAVTETNSKGFTITNQDILDTVTGKKPPTAEFRAFVDTMGGQYSSYVRENAVKYPEGIFRGELPEAKAPITGEMIKIPSMSDTSLVEDAKSYMATVAQKAAYGKDVPEEEKQVLKMMVDEMEKRNMPDASTKVSDYLAKMTDYIRGVDDHNIAVVTTDAKKNLVERVQALGVGDLAKVKGKLALISRQTNDSEKILQKVFGDLRDSHMNVLRDAGLVKNEEDFVNFIKSYPNKQDLKVSKFTMKEPNLELAAQEGKLESPLMRIIRNPEAVEDKSVLSQLKVGGTEKTVKQLNDSTVETVLDKEKPVAALDEQVKQAEEMAKAQAIYETLQKESKPTFKTFQAMKKAFTEPIDTFKDVIGKLYPSYFTPSEARNIVQQEYQKIPGEFLTFLKQKSGYLDMTFSAMEDFFNKYSETQRMGFLAFAQSSEKPFVKSEMPVGQMVADLVGKEELKGTPKALEQLLVKNTPEVLRSPELLKAVRSGFDSVFTMIETLPKRFQTKYVEDYFRTMWDRPDSVRVVSLTKQWSSLITSTNFNKEKYWDYIVEGLAAGEKLKVTNPIAMLKNEVESVLTLKSLANVEERLLALNQVVDTMKMKVQFVAPTESAPKGFVSSGIKGLEHLSFEPQVARLINALYAPASIKSSRIGGAIYNLALFQRGIQLLLPTYHFGVITTLSLHDTAGLSPINLLNPLKRTLEFGQVKKDWEAGMGTEMAKLYEEYIGIGGETMTKNRSYEQEGVNSLASGIITAFNKVGEKSGFLEPVVNAAGGLMTLPTKLSDAIFNHYIPAQKFGSYAMWSDYWTKKLGRDMTVDEKRSLIMKLQNPYGEMNESLFGRSRTTQQGLRLIFRAPGFREGNFKFIFDTLNIKDPLNQTERRMVLNGIATTALLGITGTLAFTGKMPQIKRKEDFYDLFTINTGIKDKSGNDVIVDLPRLFNLRDYYNILGNMVTARPDIALRDLGSTVYSALSPNVTEAKTGLDVMQGKQTTDYVGRPTSALNAMLGDIQPIPLSTAEQTQQKGLSPALQFLTGAGLPITTTQDTKDAGRLRSQVYNLVQQRNTLSGQAKKATNIKDRILLNKQVDDMNKQIGDSVKQLEDVSRQTTGQINKKFRIPKQVRKYEASTP